MHKHPKCKKVGDTSAKIWAGTKFGKFSIKLLNTFQI